MTSPLLDQGRRIGDVVCYRPRKNFGTWKLVGDCLVLKSNPDREVDLERCVNAFEILDWIFHYKSRITQEELADLIFAFDTILHPRKNYRTSKGNNPKALLRQHLSDSTKTDLK